MSWNESDLWADEKARKAITDHNLRTFKFYIPNICNPDKADINGDTCLHEAAIALEPEFVSHLLSPEVDAFVFAENKRGQTPLQAARQAWDDRPEIPTEDEFSRYGKVMTLLREAENRSVRPAPEGLFSWLAKSVKRTFGADIAG